MYFTVLPDFAKISSVRVRLSSDRSKTWHLNLIYPNKLWSITYFSNEVISLYSPKVGSKYNFLKVRGLICNYLLLAFPTLSNLHEVLLIVSWLYNSLIRVGGRPFCILGKTREFGSVRVSSRDFGAELKRNILNLNPKS